MSLAAVRTQVAGVVSGVSGIGRVHDYLRLITDEAGIKTHAVAAGALHMWCVSLSESDTIFVARYRQPAGAELASYGFSIHGWMAVDDSAATEKTWATLVESVITAFRSNKKLGNTVVNCSPANWVEGGYRVLVNVLCHYARLSLVVQEQVL